MYERRRQLRLQSKECAERAGIPAQMWSDLETDRSRRKDGLPTQPRLETLQRIADALESPLSELLEATGFTDSVSDENEDPPAFIAYYNELPENVQEDIEAQIEALWRKHRRSQTTHGKKAE